MIAVPFNYIGQKLRVLKELGVLLEKLNRTQTIMQGALVCDFRITLE